MRENETNQRDGATYCLRHPNTESNLRCGRCGDLICPRCLVNSPVGARCPNCARIGRAKALDTSATEMGRAIIVGVIAAIIGAAALNVILWLLPLPLLAAPLIVGIGFLVGEGVRIGSGNKLDRRLKYVAFGLTFFGWLAASLMAPFFSISIAAFGNVYGIAGLIIGMYVASYRVRVP